MEAVDGLDHQEHRKGDDEEIQNGGQEAAVFDGDLRGGIGHPVGSGNSGLQHDLPIGKINAAGEYGDQGHDDVIHKGSGDLTERTADDDADGHIHHIASGDKGFKLSHEAFFLFGCGHRKNLLLVEKS